MFSLARSRYTLPTQFVFLAVNALGLLFSTIYNANTPDLYPNNAHHKLGWLVTWVLSAQVLVSLLGRVVGAFNKAKSGENGFNAAERRSFIPVSHAAMDQHQHFHSGRYSSLCRNSNDSGHGTEANTESLRSASFSSIPDTLASPTAEHEHHKEFAEDDEDLEADLAPTPRGGVLGRFASKVGNKISSRAWKVLMFAYNFVDRTSMILGFVTLCTGIVTMGRFFVSCSVSAHCLFIAASRPCVTNNVSRRAARFLLGWRIGSRAVSFSGWVSSLLAAGLDALAIWVG